MGAAATHIRQMQEYRGDDVVAHHNAVVIEDVGTVGFACQCESLCRNTYLCITQREMHNKCLIIAQARLLEKNAQRLQTHAVCERS